LSVDLRNITIQNRSLGALQGAGELAHEGDLPRPKIVSRRKIFIHCSRPAQAMLSTW